LYYSFSGYPPLSKKDSAVKLPEYPFEGPAPINSPKIIFDSLREVETIITDTSGRFKPDTLNKRYFDFTGFFHYEIDPARIGAIWNEKFNNTILATKEFEERLRYMHSLCTAEYLNAYLEGLNYPLYKIDQLCADNSTGQVRKKFLEFAARKDGRVIINEGMQAKLSEYFQIKYKAYQQAAAEAWAKYNTELARLNAIADDKQREQTIRDLKRDSSNYQEEFYANLLEAYRQLGIKYYNVTIPATGWYNLDVFVKQVTASRQTGTYTDSETGKTVTLTYKEVNISIANLADYDKVFVYLLPDGLGSFQRMKQKGNVFDESLNSLFKYDAVAIAYKGTEIFFYRQTAIQPGEYSFKLSPVTENELKEILKNYSGNKPEELKTELEYRLFEQQEVIRQVQLRKDIEFRQIIEDAIFNCTEGDALRTTTPAPAKDSLKSK
jgi:hypothetical protein